MFERKVVLYGTGGQAKDMIRDPVLRDRILCVAGREDDVADGFDGIAYEKDDILRRVDEPFDMIIASQYFDVIWDRLSRESKMGNENLHDVYVPNLMGRKPPYDPETLPKISEAEWEWLESEIHCGSLELLHNIKRERLAPGYPAVRFVHYADGLHHAGHESYWDTVKGSRKHDKVVVIDVGAYIGDTIDSVIDAVGGAVDTYYALEPMRENYDVLKKRKFSRVRNFIALCNALGKDEAEISFTSSVYHKDAFSVYEHSAYNTGLNINTQTVKMITLDGMCIDQEADYFVKMDIEGSELDAIRGGIRFIKKKRPNLAICLYHKTRDLIEIPMAIKDIVPDYELHLVGGSHTILIAK